MKSDIIQCVGNLILLIYEIYIHIIIIMNAN
jgi:hypothetical protein